LRERRSPQGGIKVKTGEISPEGWEMGVADYGLVFDRSEQSEAGDASRERKGFFEWAPSRSLLASIRAYQRWKPKWYALPLAKLAVLRHRFWSVVTGADIPLNSRIGLGLLLPHPTGVVIHPNAKIGPDCLILSCVTIGTGPKPGAPVLGVHVDVGTGAKILGGVQIGDHAVIGAGAWAADESPGADPEPQAESILRAPMISAAPRTVLLRDWCIRTGSNMLCVHMISAPGSLRNCLRSLTP
jgi:serine O-acetyltransferase